MRQHVFTVVILFSGGDSPGMNALLRVFVRLGLNRHGGRVLGVKDGYRGLVRTCEGLDACAFDFAKLRERIEQHVGRKGINDWSLDMVQMDHWSVSGIVNRGGIVLGSSRCEEFKLPGVRERVIKLLSQQLGVDAVVVVGGDGSLRGAHEFAKESGMTVIGIPATIDNDHPLTERSLGFETAVHTIVENVHRVNDTAASHRRIIVLETMGRHSGQLAQTAALSSGAEIVVTPDRGALNGEKLQGIAERIQKLLEQGRSHAIVLVTEGVQVEPPERAGPSEALANYLREYFDHIAIRGEMRHVDIRKTVLGHLQRGGSPSVFDRQLAADSAESAWNAITADKPRSGVLGLVQGRIALLPFDAAPLPDRQLATQRIYHLHKDISAHPLTTKDASAVEPIPARRKRKPAQK